MDMSFANQALSAEYLVKHARRMSRQVYPVPEDIDSRSPSSSRNRWAWGSTS